MAVKFFGHLPENPTKLKAIVKYCLRSYRALPRQVNIIFVSQKVIQQLNRQYRQHNKPTTILSFNFDLINLSKDQQSIGEIYLSSAEIRLAAKKSKLAYQSMLYHLVIHGCLHLAGFHHQKMQSANTMHKEEKKLAEKFTPNILPSHVIH
ncbi:rRNA maturation RNase YbeY [Patescibacteria group bacterium]